MPGVRVNEHLPLQASIMDRLAIVRSVDCSASNDHFPAPMQAGNPFAQRSKLDRNVGTHPSMGAVAAHFRGANDPALPAFVGMADLNFRRRAGRRPPGRRLRAGRRGSTGWPTDSGEGRQRGQGGGSRRPVPAVRHVRRDLDTGDTMSRMDRYRRQTLDIVLSGKAQQAFRIDREPDRVRDAYGRHSLGEQALLARRLVEAGVTFVTVSGTFGVFDNHGDDVIWGGIIKGMKPQLPRMDQAVSALVKDLEVRGLLNDTLVLMMGEMGRSPQFSQRGTGGANTGPTSCRC